jgi:LysR family transcriptional regulator, low CO2-responsive transcriptional regulator
MLDLHKLAIFETVAREGSFSAAAERLYLSQSSVSQHVRELESSLGVQLFERGRGGVSLTPKGEQLYTMAKDLLHQAAEIERQIMDVTQVTNGRLRVGATPGVGAYLLPSWLRGFQQQCTRVRVSLHTGTTDYVLNEVRHRALDLGMTEGDPTSTPAHDVLHYQQLTAFEQFVVVGTHHPWHGRDAIAIAELNGQCLITRQPGSHSRTWLEGVLARHGISVEVDAAFDGLEAIKQSLMHSATCAAVLPAYTLQGELAGGQLHAIHVTDVALERGLWLVTNRDMPVSPFAEAFVKAAHDLAAPK